MRFPCLGYSGSDRQTDDCESRLHLRHATSALARKSLLGARCFCQASLWKRFPFEARHFERSSTNKQDVLAFCFLNRPRAKRRHLPRVSDFLAVFVLHKFVSSTKLRRLFAKLSPVLFLESDKVLQRSPQKTLSDSRNR